MTAFDAIATGTQGDLFAAALELARDEYPDLDVPRWQGELRQLVAGLELYASLETDVNRLSPAERLELLNRYFYHELGFAGCTNDYYDPRNSYLCDVLERRTGIPISLSLVYRELARSLGVELCGVNLPGHFVLAYPPRLGKRIYLDVFHGGEVVDWQGCCERVRSSLKKNETLVETAFPPMLDREILVRMLRNLKGIFSNHDAVRALQVQQRLVKLLPDEPAEQRDLGLLFSRNGKPIHALKTLQDLVRRHPRMGEVEFIQDSLRDAAREAALVN